MKHLIMICNLESMHPEELRTSSSRYELGFAKELSKRIERVSIVSPKINGDSKHNNVFLYACSSKTSLYEVSPIINTVKRIINTADDTVILFWGYNPILIKELCKLKSAHTKLVTMVYDTHFGELAGKNFGKRLLIKFFYKLGICQINRLDGVFLFKRKAQEHLRIKTKWCVILPSVDVGAIVDFSASQKEGLTFLYSGTLCEYNGINELLGAFALVDDKQSVLKIFGDGPLSSKVEAAAQTEKRIIYGGRISNKDLSEEIKKADVLLNLRQVPSIVNDFAYPSKLMEYMLAGKVVMSTKVSEAEEFDQAVYLLADLEKSTIVNSINYVCSHREEFESKVQNAVHYLDTYHSNDIVMSRAHDFMFEELF